MLKDKNNLDYHRREFLNRKVWLLFIVISLVVSTGCSRFMYNQADWLAGWYVGDYIDFNRAQKKQFKRLAKELHLWHRTTELPRYKAFLQEQKQFFSAAQQEATPTYMKSVIDRFVGFSDDFMLELLPKMTTILSQLSDQQVKDLIEELKKEQGEMERVAQKETEEDVFAEREKEMESSFKRWLGKLDKSQKRRIAIWARSIVPIYDESLVHRKRWIEHFTATLNNRSDKEALAKALKVYFIYPKTLWEPSYKQKMEENTQKTYVMLSDVVKAASEKQLSHLDKTLSGYIRDIDKLTR